MARIDSAYDYYIATYANREVSRYDSHKKSDLRRIYNNIVRTNKESPLYKIPNVQDATKYAIDIKEHAKSIQNVVASLSDQYGNFGDSFQKKVAESSDEKSVSVKYIGNGKEENPANEFTIEILQLASPQNNMGNYLKDNSLSFTPGNYSFDLTTNTSSYEFQYSVNVGENNLNVVQKLANLVNNANLGITAEVLSDGEGSSALSLTSRHTGVVGNEEYLFSISPSANTDSITAMDLLGINNITSPAANSSFLLNGIEHSSASNTFTINNAFELSLKATNAGSPATIGFKTNTDAVADNLQTLIDAYNSMVDTAHAYAGSKVGDGNRLYNDLSSLTLAHRASLGYIGLMVDDDSRLSIDRDILSSAVSPERAEDTFDALAQFKDSMGNKADHASVNPMFYVNKVLVAYKNPGHNFATPYISSIYSGMMLDSFV